MQALRYVVLWHSEIERPHYDLMFETSPRSALATWRSPIWPISAATELTKLRDHRAAFLSFQGVLSGDRGNVTQIDAGTCRIEINSPSNWLINLLDSPAPQKLSLRQVRDDLWQAAPVEIAD